MSLRVFNTLSQKKELFDPIHPGKVTMYLCGPTVYKPSHIGHAVGPIIFDTIKRYLKFKGFDVTWVVNVTDVDDKLIDEAKVQGCGVMELAETITANYLAALRELAVTSIDHLPKASEHIPDIIDMCQKLLDKDVAYVSGGDLYFDVSKDDDYGKLSHRKSEDQQAGTRKLTGEEKRNPHDFALWKAAKPEEPDDVKYDSPWGKGRPGWHIECSAMSVKYLGESFDIHGGGMDLIFPHHENEIAQSETCFDKPFAKYWLHNGLTRFNTKKISKSDAEMRKMMDALVLSNLLSKHTGELIRFFVLSTQYRRPIEFSDEEIAAKRKGLESIYRLFERIQRVTGQDPYAGGDGLDRKLYAEGEDDVQKSFIKQCLDLRLRFLEAMDDDFNTGGAVGVLFELVSTINKFMDDLKVEISQAEKPRALAGGAVQTVRQLGGILGLFGKRPGGAGRDDGVADSLMQLLIDVRAEARKTKQFALADLIRDRLGELKITLEDRADGTGWRMDG